MHNTITLAFIKAEQKAPASPLQGRIRRKLKQVRRVKTPRRFRKS